MTIRRILSALCLFLLLSSDVYAFKMAVGHYTSNNTGSTNICFTTCTATTKIENTCDAGSGSCANFDIIALFIRCNISGTAHVVYTSTSMSAGQATFLSTTTANATGRITSIGNGVFVLPAGGYTNPTPAVTCYYTAFGSDTNNDIAVGSYSTNASGQTVTISPAFQPEAVMVRRRGTATTGGKMWLAAPGGDSTAEMNGAGGTNLTGCVTGVTASGFTTGTSVDCDAGTTETYDYLAIKLVPGYVDTDTYAGSTTPDNRQFTTLGFNPHFEWIFRYDSTTPPAFRWGIFPESTDLSWHSSGAGAVNIIQQFLSNGFEVGTDGSVNVTGRSYEYLAVGIPVYATKKKINPGVHQ